jgi:hypothetical protein
MRLVAKEVSVDFDTWSRADPRPMPYLNDMQRIRAFKHGSSLRRMPIRHRSDRCDSASRSARLRGDVAIPYQASPWVEVLEEEHIGFIRLNNFSDGLLISPDEPDCSCPVPPNVPNASINTSICASRLLKNGSAAIFSFGCRARSGLDCDRKGASCLPWHELRSQPDAESSLGIRIRL